MRHLLLVKNGNAGRQSGREQMVHDALPVRFSMTNNLGRAGMGFAGLLQVEGIEGFVDDNGIGSVPQDRIIAVEMLRGPDHIARRNSFDSLGFADGMVKKRSRSSSHDFHEGCIITASRSRYTSPEGTIFLPNSESKQGYATHLGL